QSCSVSYTPTMAGPHSIVAKYAGDGAHADSTSPPAAVTATKHPTATGLVCDPLVRAGGAATGTATVPDSVPPAPFPPWPFYFFSDGAAPPFPSFPPRRSSVLQSCSVSYTPTTAGPHSIVAKYAGDGAHADSTSPPAAVTATKHPTATGLVCDPSVPVGRSEGRRGGEAGWSGRAPVPAEPGTVLT